MTYFILLCGGKGLRMKLDSPKQYLRVNNEYVFMYSIKALKKIKVQKKLIIAAEPQYFELFKDEVSKYFNEFTLIKGGSCREESVLNALNSIKDFSKNDKVLIHDSARMFLNKEILELILNELKTNDSAIPYKNSTNALFDENLNQYLLSKEIKQIETPQGFILCRLKEAFKEINDLNAYNDDGSIYLNYYKNIHLVFNPYYNLKITTLDDLKEINLHL